jgi:hypothetical protein
MNLHRLRVDVRLERGEVVGQGWQLMGHCNLLGTSNRTTRGRCRVRGAFVPRAVPGALCLVLAA